MSARKRAFAPPFEVRVIGPATLVRGDCREVLARHRAIA